jgi:hypothetical protein
VIALCSPDGIVGTGLPMCPSEKRRSRTRSRGESEAFSSPVQLQYLQNLPRFLAIFEEMRRGFSAFQTAWLSGRDSNPWYGFATLSLDVRVSYR